MLGLNRLDISASASLRSAAIVADHGELDLETATAAWRLLEVGDTPGGGAGLILSPGWTKRLRAAGITLGVVVR
jgi:hypothetical protein